MIVCKTVSASGPSRFTGRLLSLMTLLLITGLIVSNFQLKAQQSAVSAQQVIEQIKKNSGVPWTSATVDVFKTGNPETRVTGIVTTMFATMDILKQAVSLGCNLIITHEPTFYNHMDDTSAFIASGNKVYADKRRYIEDHNLIIWRYHDHIHMRQPDDIIAGVVHRLGWEKYEDASRQSYFVMPETSLRDLATLVKKNLDISMLRVIGDPGMKITRVALAPGAPGSEPQINALEQADVEVLLIGESPEWETLEYARDAAAQGKRKALIILGHVPSEEAGMEACAVWLRTFLKEIPVKYIQTREPFWIAR
jgi:putative NIF3 family GTP cyclohydrolase 1 type 2